MTESLMFINNSRETYTPTNSGAIATCIEAVARQAASDGVETTIVTRRHPSVSATLAGSRVRELPAVRVDRTRFAATFNRGRRRLTGWARPDQRSYAIHLVRLLREVRPRSVIVSNDPEIAVHLRHRFPQMNVVHWFHNLELASDRFRRQFAADAGITSVAVSAYLARAVEHAYRMTPGAVAVNLNGVDTTEFAVPDRPDRVPVVGFLGRVAVEKGVDVLLDAALLLTGTDVPFALQIAGDTNWGQRQANPYIRGVDGRVEALRARGVVVATLGHLSRAAVPVALAASDIHVFPSRWDEPFGLALLEGMASGQAVVASATGGAPEVLAGSGSLFVREDARALADALAPLLVDAGLRDRRGDAARRRAEELTWQETWRRLRALVSDRSASTARDARGVPGGLHPPNPTGES